MNKNRIILLLLPILATIPVGMFGCGFYICVATITPLLVISFTIVLYVVIKLIEENKFSFVFKIFSILLIPGYIFGILFLTNTVMTTYLDYSNYQSWIKFDTKRIDKNSLIENGDMYIYKNKTYHYQIQIPKGWGFIADSTFAGAAIHPAGKDNYANKTEILINTLPPDGFTPVSAHNKIIQFQGLNATLDTYENVYITTITFNKNGQQYQIEVLSQNTPLREKYVEYIKNAFTFVE